MKVIVTYVGDILHCPPALSLVQILNDLKIDTTLLTTGVNKDEIINSIGSCSNLNITLVDKEYKNINLLFKFLRMYKLRFKFWREIKKIYCDDTVIWVVSEECVKNLGNKLLHKKYILHLLELNEGIYYISGNPILKMNHNKISKNAKVIVEAEYNRSHIIKAWWNLDKIPMIFPNKPYNFIDIRKNSEITSNEDVKILMKKLQNKKIILYQGNISRERPLDEYIKAVSELGDEYAFVMMINGENPYPNLKFDNFYCIHFIKPPFHLEVTSHAYIGILSYTPIKNSYSILNTLYCAPNKVWEYSKFGIPMIGNDLPALKELFLEYNNGICLKKLKKENIKEAIKMLEKDYDQYSQNSISFFNSVDLKKVVKEILDECKK